MKLHVQQVMRSTIILLTLLTVLFPASAAFAERASETELYGVVVSLPASGLVGDWKVGRVTVHVSNSTVIDQTAGPVVVGAHVEVEGTRQGDGSMNAAKIEVKARRERVPFKRIVGAVQSLPNTTNLIGDWVVNGITVHVGERTRIDHEHGAIVVGTIVEVIGVSQSDGSLNARGIKVRRAATGNNVLPTNALGSFIRFLTPGNFRGFFGAED